MSTGEDRAALGERLRLKALARFFAPNHITADIVEGPHDTQPLTPSLSESTQLTAIAQNGALKLQCDRTFVSLIDASTLYVVAEATRTISLRDPNRYSTPQDALLLGVQFLDKSYGICPNSFSIFTDTTGKMAVDTHDVVSNKTRHVIRDLRTQEEYKDRSFVVGFPCLRSYVEVPIKDSQGQVLGSYCAVDTKVRDDFFDDETIYVLTEIAQCITDHFESQVIQYNHARGERLMRGLTEFTREKSKPSAADILEKSNVPQRLSNVAKMHDSSPQHIPDLEHPSPAISSPETSCSDDHLSSIPSNASTGITTPSDGTGVTSVCSKLVADDSGKGDSEAHDIFAHGAELIRVSMDLEGLLFLDGSTKVKTNESTVTPLGDELENLCRVLGSSLSSKGSTLSTDGTLPILHEISLKYLVDKHPDGCIFTADDYGILQHDADDTSTFQQSLLEESMPHKLFTLIKKARSLIFLPLWDYSKESIFVGLVGWSTDPTRVLEEPDMTCLNAFGNTFLTELARSEAVAISRAKSDFLSSISHELRSPLHGVLATVELLSETEVDSSQADLIEMIHSCGSTLLDTLNHLLDFSKISEFADAKSHARQRSNENKQNMLESTVPQSSLSQKKEDYLCQVVQDTVEVVHFGQTSQSAAWKKTRAETYDVFSTVEKLTDCDASIARSCITDVSILQKVSDPVGVFLYMENRDDWFMSLCAGAWKRIALNLIGNALKYTEEGHIEISLRMLPNDSHKRTIHLMVKDTGIGMNEDYIKHHLYTPFVQENPLTNGTGLGLSIVKQIVEDLGGSISVQSKPGSGTCFDVLVPISEADTMTKQLTGDQMLDPGSELKGLTLCLLSNHSMEKHDSCHLYSRNSRTAAMHANVTAIAKEWFSMRAVSAQSPEETDADIYLVESWYLSSLLQSDDKAVAAFSGKRLIVVEPARSISKDSNGLSGKTARLTYPIGPKSLYKALAAALKLKADETLHGAEAHMLPIRLSATTQDPAITVNIDVKIEDLRVPKVVQPNPYLVPQTQHHLLLVDDNAINLKILSTLVKRLGISAETAENGLEAYERYKTSTTPFSLVFMDLNMPVMDGYEASRAIRDFETKHPHRKPAKIVALTGLGSESSRHEAALCGIDEFLTKPVKLKVLKEMLGAV